MIVVDTNVLIYAADADSPLHVASRNWLEGRRRQPDAWYTTWAVVYEFLRVTTHPRVMRRPWTIKQAWRFVAALLDSPALGLLVVALRHAEVAAEVFAELPHCPATCFTMHIPQSSCVNMEFGGFARGTRTFIVSRLSR